jgi:hypothetical protein
MDRYFSYDPDGNYFETHATLEAAKAKAESAFQHERQLAIENDEWGERVDEICYGQILGRVQVAHEYLDDDNVNGRIEYALMEVENET